MKKQYWFTNGRWPEVIFHLYHDGVLIKDYVKTENETSDEIEKLNALGYVRGFHSREVYNAQQTYEYRAKNLICKHGEEYAWFRTAEFTP
jgi:hypothetical protein